MLKATLLALSLLLLAACSLPFSKPASTPKPTPVVSSLVPCLFGSWTLISETDNPLDATAQVSGGTNATLTIDSTGAATLDYAASQPLNGLSVPGHATKARSELRRGTLAWSLTDIKGSLFLSPVSSTATSTLTLDKTTKPAVAFAGPARSSVSANCSASALTLRAIDASSPNVQSAYNLKRP
jgi:hypothetical protein